MPRYLERRAHWRQAAPHPGTPPFRRQTYALTTKHNKKKKDILRCPFLCFCPPYRLTYCPPHQPAAPLRRHIACLTAAPAPAFVPAQGSYPRPGFQARSSLWLPISGGLDDFKKILHSLAGEIYIWRLYLCCKCEIIYFCMKPKAGTINKIAAKW